MLLSPSSSVAGHVGVPMHSEIRKKQREEKLLKMQEQLKLFRDDKELMMLKAKRQKEQMKLQSMKEQQRKLTNKRPSGSGMQLMVNQNHLQTPRDMFRPRNAQTSMGQSRNMRIQSNNFISKDPGSQNQKNEDTQPRQQREQPSHSNSDQKERINMVIKHVENMIARKLQEGFNVNVNQLETAISEVMGQDRRPSTQHGQDSELETLRRTLNSSRVRIKSSKINPASRQAMLQQESKRPSQEEYKSEYYLTRFRSDKFIKYKPNNQKPSTSQSSRNPMQVDQDAGKAESETVRLASLEENDLIQIQQEDKKSLTPLSYKYQLSYTSDIAKARPIVLFKSLDSAELMVKLKALEEAQRKEEQDQEKAKIDEYLTGMFEDDHNFLMLVSKTKGQPKKTLKKFKPKNELIKKIKPEKCQQRELHQQLIKASKPIELTKPRQSLPDISPSPSRQQSSQRYKLKRKNSSSQKASIKMTNAILQQSTMNDKDDRVLGWPVINEDIKSVKDGKEDSPYSPRKNMLIDLRTSQKFNTTNEHQFDGVQPQKSANQPFMSQNDHDPMLEVLQNPLTSKNFVHTKSAGFRGKKGKQEEHKDTVVDIDDYLLYNQEETPNGNDQTSGKLIQEGVNDTLNSPYTRREGRADESLSIAAPSRLFSMQSQQIKIRNFNALKKSQNVKSRVSTKRGLSGKLLQHKVKELIIISRSELSQLEDIFMEDYFKQRSVQKSLLRSLAGQVNAQHVKKVGVVIEEAQLADSILYLYWKQKMAKQYFIVSNPEILDRMDQNLDDEKILEHLSKLEIDIQYSVSEISMDRKQEDQEFMDMLNQVDNVHEQSNQYMDMDIFNDINFYETDSISRSQDFYFQQDQRKIRKKISKKFLKQINNHIFSQRFDDVLSFYIRRGVLDHYSKRRQIKGTSYRRNYDKYNHRDLEVHNPSWQYLTMKPSPPQSELVRSIFNLKRDCSIFYLLIDPDEDYELALKLDKMVYNSIKSQERKKQSVKPEIDQLRVLLYSQHKTMMNMKTRKLNMKRESNSDCERAIAENDSLLSREYDEKKEKAGSVESEKHQTSFRSMGTSSLSDHKSLMLFNQDLNSSQSSVDHDLLPVERKNALRKKFGFRRQNSPQKDSAMFIKLNVFKGRISSSLNVGKNVAQLSVIRTENYEMSDSEDSVKILSKSRNKGKLGENKFTVTSNNSSSISGHEELSIIQGMNPYNPRQAMDRNEMRRISIKIGKLNSRVSLPKRKPSKPIQIMRLEEIPEKKISQTQGVSNTHGTGLTLTVRKDSMEGILIDKFGYESMIRADDSNRFMFEVFVPTEVENIVADNESEIREESDDHITTDSSLRDQEDDKFADFDFKIQKQNLKKFFQQQKLQNKGKPQFSKQSSTPRGLQRTGEHPNGISPQVTMGTTSAAHKVGKNSLIQLHHNYTSIGTYYKNLSKKQREDQKKQDQDQDNAAGEVVSGEEFIEDDENNFYLQMRNNIKIMELLDEAGANKSPKVLKKYKTLKRMSKNVKDFKEDDNSSSRHKWKIQTNQHEDEVSLFTNSDEKYNASEDGNGNQQKKQSVKSYGSKGGFADTRVEEELKEYEDRSPLSSQGKVATMFRRKMTLHNLRQSKASNVGGGLKRNMFMRDQGLLEKAIIQAVDNQDTINLSILLKKFELSLDKFRDTLGNTLLSSAVQLGNKTITEMLLNQGADPNIQNVRNKLLISTQYDGNTPLHYSIGHGQTKITDILMSFGANEQIANKEGRTPWDKFN